jgi:putative transposase
MNTFFVTILTHDKKFLLQNDRYAALLANCIFHYRDQGQFAVHAFVIMPDHAHIVLSPMSAKTVERSVQLIKGSFSYRVRKEIGYPGEVWRQSFHDRRVLDTEAFAAVVEYTHQSPVRRGLCTDAREFRFSSARPEWRIDETPQWLKSAVAEELSRA